MDDVEAVDRLSELPDSLIFEILSLLETRDAVTASLLSKGWKDFWTTTIPYLDFNESAMSNFSRTRSFINGILQSCKGTTKILRFKISIKEIRCTLNDSIRDDISRLIGFVTEKKVEDFVLDFPPRWKLEAPECLFSCSSITKLKLSGFRFHSKLGINVQWDRLKSLEIIRPGILNQEFLQQLVSSSPQLQILDAYISIRDDISIRDISCLKRLTLRGKYSYPKSTTNLTIEAPNLEELSLSEFAYKRRLLLDAPALTDASLCLYDQYPDNEQVFEEALKHLLLPIQNVEALSLVICSNNNEIREVLGNMKDKCLFSNLKMLKLIGSKIKPHDILGCVLDLFPKVEKLVIVLHKYSKSTGVTLFRMQDPGEKHCEVANNPNSFLLQLRRVEVAWDYDDADKIHTFIELVLKDAIMVEEIVIKKVEDYYGHESEDKGLAEKTQKMKSLQDSFPTLNMIFS